MDFVNYIKLSSNKAVVLWTHQNSLIHSFHIHCIIFHRVFETKKSEKKINLLQSCEFDDCTVKAQRLSMHNNPMLAGEAAKNVNYLVNAWDVAGRHFFSFSANERKLKRFIQRALKSAFFTPDISQMLPEMKFLIFYPYFSVCLPFFQLLNFCWTESSIVFIHVHYPDEAGGFNVLWIAVEAAEAYKASENLHFIHSTPRHAAWYLIECDLPMQNLFTLKLCFYSLRAKK